MYNIEVNNRVGFRYWYINNYCIIWGCVLLRFQSILVQILVCYIYSINNPKLNNTDQRRMLLTLQKNGVKRGKLTWICHVRKKWYPCQ